MKYIYILALTAFLTACGKPLTIEQVEMAKAYCTSKNTALVLFTNWGMEPTFAKCKADGNYLYRVTLEQMK